MTNSTRKLFFGLFVFPLLIAVGMAVLLCSVVLMTHEPQTPESLIAAIKTGSPGKRWQRAFELSNELNKRKGRLRDESLIQEMSHILQDKTQYDPKTRSYMAIALSHFPSKKTVEILQAALQDPSEEVQLYALWSLGRTHAQEAAPRVRPFLQSDQEELRKMAAYVLGVLQDRSSIPALKALLQDPVADLRWNAALALARLGDDSGSDTLGEMLDREKLTTLYKLNEGQIEAVMINAIKGLALIRKPESIRILETLSQKDKNLKVRQAAWDALKDG